MRRLLTTIVIALASGAIACGGAPTAPGALASHIDKGGSHGGGNMPAPPTTPPTPTTPTPTTEPGDDHPGNGREIQIEGIVTKITSTGLTVGVQDVTVTKTTVIEHGDTMMTLADIHVGDRVHVKGNTPSTSTTATTPKDDRPTTGTGTTPTPPTSTTIVATKIEVQNGENTPGHSGDDDGGGDGQSGTGSGSGSGS